ncbi:MAG: hypothetical protein K2G23_06060, partial [Muribaculaceae bacterium]|nr:hypothetical protein [Muribaculaceae bacterium]
MSIIFSEKNKIYASRSEKELAVLNMAAAWLPRLYSDGQIPQAVIAIEKYIKWLNESYTNDQPMSVKAYDRGAERVGTIDIFIYYKGCKRVRKDYLIGMAMVRTEEQFSDALFRDLQG